jgi:hypothetical protein
MATVKDQDLGWKKIKKTIRAADGWTVTVGVHGTEQGRPGEIDNIALAAIHEFGTTFQHPGGTPYKIVNGKAVFVKKGTPGAYGVTKAHEITIPERSFLRAAFDKNVRKYAKLLERGARQMAAGRSSAKQVLGILGEVSVSDTVNLINAGIPPPNRPATIKRKGSSKPLIDTAQLKGAIKAKVSKA